MNDFNNFLERATALRDAIKKNAHMLKDVKLDILGQIVNQVFIDEGIPHNFTIHSYSGKADSITFEILKELEIVVEITSVEIVHYPITKVSVHVNGYWT